MKKLKFLNESDAKEIIELIDDYLDCKYIVTGNNVEVNKDKRYECKICGKKKARYRISTQDYRCENCKVVFK